jgi:sugar phosphate isomerase/epimerase
MIRYAGDLLTHVLVSDSHHVERIIAPPEVKAHEHTVPGSGDVDFFAVFAALREIGYERTLSAHLISERDRITAAARSTRGFLLTNLR